MLYNKPFVGIISAGDYNWLKACDKMSMVTEDLPEWLVEQIAASEMDAEYDHLDLGA